MDREVCCAAVVANFIVTCRLMPGHELDTRVLEVMPALKVEGQVLKFPGWWGKGEHLGGFIS